jgi:hypothetical protein
MEEEREGMPIHGADPVEVAGGGRSGRREVQPPQGERSLQTDLGWGKVRGQELPPRSRPDK